MFIISFFEYMYFFIGSRTEHRKAQTLAFVNICDASYQRASCETWPNEIFRGSTFPLVQEA